MQHDATECRGLAAHRAFASLARNCHGLEERQGQFSDALRAPSEKCIEASMRNQAK